MCSKFMPQTPTKNVATAKMPAQAARRFVTSLSSMVTIDKLTWMAVPMVSRMVSILVCSRARWSAMSRK